MQLDVIAMLDSSLAQNCDRTLERCDKTPDYSDACGSLLSSASALPPF